MKKIAVSLILSLFILVSCSKQADTPSANTSYRIEGLWTGTFSYDPGVSTITTPQYFSFVIKPGGSLLVESTDNGTKYYATGTWTLNGNAFTCSYTYFGTPNGSQLSQNASATWDNSGTLTAGKWNNTSNTNQKGSFTMTRVN
jgi:hypothetical protein